MKTFNRIEFDPAILAKELEELRELLATNDELGERDRLLPFFRQRPQLAASLGFYNGRLANPDLIAFELILFGYFSADIVVGDSWSGEFCMVELEDARRNSVFHDTGRATPAWSSRLEQGFSQLIDWHCLLHEMKATGPYHDLFGHREISSSALLVVGRDHHLDDAMRRRLDWRAKRVLLDSCHAQIVTFDHLLKHLAPRAGQRPAPP